MAGKYISLENLSRFKDNADKTYILRDSELQEIIGNLSINGNLSVNGTTTTVNHENITVNSAVIITNNNGADLSTTLSGLAIKTGTDNQAYGIMFSKAEDESVLLGLGTVAEDNSFSYIAGEGSPLAIRADSTELNHNHILSWDSENLKLIDSGILNSNVVTTNTEQSISARKSFRLDADSDQCAITISKENFATYTCLYPGRFTAANSDGGRITMLFSPVANNNYNINVPNKNGTLALVGDLPRSITLTPTPSDDGTIYGTVGSSDLLLLQASDNNYVTLNGKLYRLSNKQSTTLSYTNTDIDSSGNLSIGTIIVTISDGAWQLYESEMAGSSDITNIFS